MKLVVLLVAVIVLAACGGSAPADPFQPSQSPKTFTATDLFPIKAGDKWTMVNDLGDHTFFEVQPGPAKAACEAGEILILRISKDHARTYWHPNDAGAEDRYYMKRDADGLWRGIQDSPTLELPNIFGTDALTIQWRPVAGKLVPYVIVPPVIGVGEKAEYITQYHGWQKSASTTDCLAGQAQFDIGLSDWSSTFTTAQVDTPAYKGVAIMNEQREGPVVHEKWYFAPGVGLVQIESLTPGMQVTIKRCRENVGKLPPLPVLSCTANSLKTRVTSVTSTPRFRLKIRRAKGLCGFDSPPGTTP
jgi:hypothetical protein